MEATKSQLIYNNACLSEGIEKLQIENEELRVQNEALGLKVKHIKEAMGDLDFYYKEKLAEKDQQIADLESKFAEKDEEINKLKELVKTIDSYNQYSDKAENFIILDPKNCYLDGHKLIIKTDKQDKIDHAVDQIYKIKNDLYENEKIYIRVCDFDEIDNIFDNHINQIKEWRM